MFKRCQQTCWYHSSSVVCSTVGEWMTDGDAQWNAWWWVGQMAALSGNVSRGSQVGARCWEWQVLQLSWVWPYCTALLLFWCWQRGFAVKQYSSFCCGWNAAAFCGEQWMPLLLLVMLTPFGWAVECCLEPVQASFYPVLLLDCLLCNWLFGRACRSGQVNDYQLDGWLVGCWSSILQSLLLFCFGENCCPARWEVQYGEEIRGGAAAVWKGPYLDVWGVPTHKILIQELNLLWTLQCSASVAEFFCHPAWNQSIARVSPSPCHLAAFVTSHQVLSEAPSVSRKAQV